MLRGAKKSGRTLESDEIELIRIHTGIHVNERCETVQETDEGEEMEEFEEFDEEDEEIEEDSDWEEVIPIT